MGKKTLVPWEKITDIQEVNWQTISHKNWDLNLGSVSNTLEHLVTKDPFDIRNGLHWKYHQF